jgi:hypothetical protein
MSSPISDASIDTQQKALEAFVAQNPDLVRLESLLARFNIFEAMGSVRHELRHSDFLSYLLDPSRNHGLDTLFLKELLQTVLLNKQVESSVSLFDLDFWNLSTAIVQREWHHIDILVTDEANRFAVIIENKIDTEEHSGQLARYYQEVSHHFLGYKMVALYLTPDGSAPSSEIYHTVSYLTVCQVVEKIVADRRSTIGAEVVMALEHYAQMLRRHIVSESEIADLCSRIYQKHRQALDLIFEHRPDQQSKISEFVTSLVKNSHELVFYHNNKSSTRFGLKEWNESLLGSEQNNNFPSSLLYFQFDHTAYKLYIKLEVGPGNQNQREKLFEMARTHSFTGFKKTLSPTYSRICTVPILSATDYEKSQEEIEAQIAQRWEVFLRDEMPRIAKAIREQDWLWEMPGVLQ